MFRAFSGRIPVCMRCRGRDLRQQSIGDGLWPGGGEGVAWVCNDCGHIGQPLLLDPEGAQAPVEADWQREYEQAAQAVLPERRAARRERERVRRARGVRVLGTVFFIVAGVFLLPPAALLTESIRATHWSLIPAAIAYALGQTWLFIGVGIVLLVMGRRKIDQAAGMSEPETVPGAEAERAAP